MSRLAALFVCLLVMKTRTLLISGTWALSCGAAFLIGRTTDSSPEKISDEETALSANSSSRSSRSARGADGSARGTGSNRSRSSRAAVEVDLKEEVGRLRAIQDPIARAEGFLKLIDELSADEFLEVVAAYREGGVRDENFGEYRILLTAWAKADPYGALEYAQENTRTSLARQTILASWAQDDAASAISWARDNFESDDEGRRANPWLVGIIEGLASTDVEQATALLEELPYSRERGQALGAIFDQINLESAEAGKDWIANLTDPQLQAGAAARLADKLAEIDPAGAAEWAASLGEDAIKRSAGNIIENWAKSDLAAARSWVDSQTTEIAAAAGPSLVSELYQSGDIDGATAWLSGRAGDPAFDGSVRTMAMQSLRENPAASADWIMQLSNEQDQERALHRVVRNWQSQDAEGLAQYVETHEVPQSIRDRIARANGNQ